MKSFFFRNLIDLVSFEKNAKNIILMYNFTGGARGGQDILQGGKLPPLGYATAKMQCDEKIKEMLLFIIRESLWGS